MRYAIVGGSPSRSNTATCPNGRSPDDPRGIWNAEDRRWEVHPCRTKDCDDHWKKGYAVPKYTAFSKHLVVDLPTYHVILKCKVLPDPGERWSNVTDFWSELHTEYSAVVLIWAKHLGGGGVHFHLLAQALEQPTKRELDLLWFRHRPRARDVSWSDLDVSLKPNDSPDNLLRYILGLSEREPREEAPWKGLPGCCARVYTSPRLREGRLQRS